MEFMIQLYVNNAEEAIALYKEAFNAELKYIEYTTEKTVLHSEIEAYGQKIAIGTATDAPVIGTVFQIDVRMKKEEDVRRTYEILKEGSQVNVPIGPCAFSSCMVDFVDKFQVRWCLFVD